MQKLIQIEGLEKPVILARRKGTKNLKISVKSDGDIRVSVPYGVPEFMAKKFITDRKEWIKEHQTPQTLISSGSHIGKSHRLTVQHNDATRHSTHVSGVNIVVRLPRDLNINDYEAQQIIRKACDKALLKESKTLLPQRVQQLSEKHNIEYNSCTIKKLKSRWGACDTHKNISLNSYLIQLDWPQIDYVIYHELAHTYYQHHQRDFWEFVASLCPDYKDLRKTLKSQPTDIIPTNF